MSKYLAIDIDPQGVFVVSGSARGGAARVEHALAWVPGADHGPPPLSADTARAIGEQLRDRLKAAGVAAAPVLVGIGRERIILKEIRYPAVPAAEEPALVRFQALKEITENPDDVVLDYAPLSNGVADPTAERRSSVVVVRKDVFAAVQAMCTAAGLKLASVTPRPFAAAAALAQALATGAAPPLSTPADAAAVLTLGPQGGEFTVVRLGQVTFTRSVPAPVMANEALLVGEVRRNLTVYAGQNPGQPVRAVYLAEAADLLGGWGGKLETGLPVPVRTFDPVAGAAEAVPDKLRGRFAGAAGLLAGKANETLPINFAAPRQPRAETDPRRKPALIGALVALAVFGVGGALGYTMLSEADRRLQAAQAEKAELDKSLTDLEPDRKRLEAADQWANREVNYLDELFDLTDRFPPGDVVRLTTLTGTARAVDKTGKQDAQALLELKGGARSADGAGRLRDAIDRDNAGNKKYYVGTQQSMVGGVIPNVAHNQPFTIVTKVNHRPPAEYTRAPVFSPPPRRLPAKGG